MSHPRDLERLNRNLPPFMKILEGRIVATDPSGGTATLSFNVGEQFCHSVNIVQGGFVTTMLDAAMSHAVFACDDTVVNISSLEISTRYLDITRAGALRAEGRIVRLSYKTAFLDGQLFDGDDRLLATTQSVAKVIRREVDDQAPGAGSEEQY